MKQETIVQKLMPYGIGAVAMLFLGVFGVVAYNMLLPRFGPVDEGPSLTSDEVRQQALETYLLIQAKATTTPPAKQLDSAIKAAAPKQSPSDAERQAALEQYLQQQNEQ